jgi:sodium/hydrogen antiporter
VLFSDAARVRVHDLRSAAGRVVRLLVLGLPLTVVAGWGRRRGCSLTSGCGWPC